MQFYLYVYMLQQPYFFWQSEDKLPYPFKYASSFFKSARMLICQKYSPKTAIYEVHRPTKVHELISETNKSSYSP